MVASTLERAVEVPPASSSSTSPHTADLRDACMYHTLTLQAEGRSPVTLRNYRFYRDLFLRYLDEHGIPATLEALSPLNVRNAAEWYRGLPHGHGKRGGEQAVRQFVERLKGWAHWLEREELIPPGTLDRVKAPRVTKHLRQPFTSDELAAMWRAARRTRETLRDEALFLLLLGTGMRIGEAATLRLDDLQLDAGRVLVGAKGKGRRERIASIGQADEPDGGRTVRALRVYLARRPDHGFTEGRVFVSRQGRPLDVDSAALIIQRIGKAAGVQDATPHRLRHTFATHYLTVYPGDEQGLRRILGHLSHDVLSDYIHLSQAALAERTSKASIVETLLPPRVRVDIDGDQPSDEPPPPPELRPVPLLDPDATEPAPATVELFLQAWRSLGTAQRRAMLEVLVGAA